MKKKPVQKIKQTSKKLATRLVKVKIPLSRNSAVLWSFCDYCSHHTQERFWQALRNWSGYSYIYANDCDQIRDTFYWESRNG